MPGPQTNPPPRALTRADVIALGRAGRPWEFLPLAFRAMAQAPADTGLRFLAAANLAQLGLRTLAGETLDRLPEHASADPEVRSLREAIDRLADDRLPVGLLRRTALGNLRALRARGFDRGGIVSRAFADWSGSPTERFRAVDGNVVSRPAVDSPLAWAAALIDQRSAAARFCEQLSAKPEIAPPPMAVEGTDPPWLFESVRRTLAPTRVGYAAPITVLQADPAELVEGFALTDLRAALMDPRVRVFVGPDASQRWINDALGRVDEAVIGMAVATPGVRTRVNPAPQAATGRVSAAQTDEFRRLQAQTASLYAGRDRAWWARRYDAAARGGEPLRVLIPTSRYSTYIRHAAADLAAAFESLGCEARVVMEASHHSKPSAVGHLRPIVEFEPDLVVLINYFRGDAGLPYPAEVPWLCWLQDSMPHQFTERVFSGLDFIAGYIHKELRERENFPAARAIAFPVVASTRKFHNGPIDADLAQRFGCEVAYVSHQSETPERFHERCKAEAGDAGAAALLDELRPLVEREATDPMAGTLIGRLRGVCATLADRRGADGAGYLFRHYAMPLADKVVRGQTLAWASEICERRGWRLRVFGRGWEEHPQFGRHAAGEVAHGEELRACYAAASVHLHASVTTLVHQRVMECALSGGLPLGRLTFDAVSESTGWAKREALLGTEPVARDAAGRMCFRVADCPALAEIIAVREHLGLEAPEQIWITPEQAESFARPDHQAATGLHPAWLYGGLDGLLFPDAAGLERLLGLAIEDADWRGEAVGAFAERVRDRCSTAVFARRAIDLISGSLGEASADRTHRAA